MEPVECVWLIPGRVINYHVAGINIIISTIEVSVSLTSKNLYHNKMQSNRQSQNFNSGASSRNRLPELGTRINGRDETSQRHRSNSSRQPEQPWSHPGYGDWVARGLVIKNNRRAELSPSLDPESGPQLLWLLGMKKGVKT